MAKAPFLQRVSEAALWTFAPDALVKRRFDAARLVSDRNQRFSTYAAEVPAALTQMRSRSRAYDSNNSYIAAAHRAPVTHLVGAEIVAASQHPDPATQTLLNTAWRRFCDECDSDGVLNMGGLQSLLTLGMIRDGEGLALTRTTPSGLRVQALDPTMIDDAKTSPLDSGGFIQSGIEFDAAGRKAAMWIFPGNPGNQFDQRTQSIRIPYDDLIHVFESKGAGQVRGIPWGHAALKRGGEIDQLEDALLVGLNRPGFTGGSLS